MTTEQELKFAVETAPVVVDFEGIVVEPTDAVVVEPAGTVLVGALDALEEEPHLSSRDGRHCYAVEFPSHCVR